MTSVWRFFCYCRSLRFWCMCCMITATTTFLCVYAWCLLLHTIYFIYAHYSALVRFACARVCVCDCAVQRYVYLLCVCVWNMMAVCVWWKKKTRHTPFPRSKAPPSIATNNSTLLLILRWACVHEHLFLSRSLSTSIPWTIAIRSLVWILLRCAAHSITQRQYWKAIWKLEMNWWTDGHWWAMMNQKEKNNNNNNNADD